MTALEANLRTSVGKKDAAGETERAALKAELAAAKDSVAVAGTAVAKAKEEFDSFRAMAAQIVEAKDKEIAKILEDTAELRLAAQRAQATKVAQADAKAAAAAEGGEPRDDGEAGDVGVREVGTASASDRSNGGGGGGDDAGMESMTSGLMAMATMQAARDTELAEAAARAEELEAELNDALQENELHAAQQALLKEEIRRLGRALERDAVSVASLPAETLLACFFRRHLTASFERPAVRMPCV